MHKASGNGPKCLESYNEWTVNYAASIDDLPPRLCALEGCGGAVPWMDRRRRYCSLKCAQEARTVVRRRINARYRRDNVGKDRCRQTLKNAITLGKVRRCTRCERCGQLTATEGHHVDYTKPFFVEWLCRACHRSVETIASERSTTATQ